MQSYSLSKVIIRGSSDQKKAKKLDIKLFFQTNYLLLYRHAEVGIANFFLVNTIVNRIVLDTHGYGYNDADGTRYEIKRFTVVDMSQKEYFLKTSFSSLELK